MLLQSTVLESGGTFYDGPPQVGSSLKGPLFQASGI